MAEGISVTGNKKVGTLVKEFSNKYPFISLAVCPMESKANAAKGGAIWLVDYSKTIASVRSKNNPGEITITGNKQIKTLEKEFEQIFGLFVQVCYRSKEGNNYYTSGALDSMTLNAFNKKCEADGCQKGGWK